MMFTQQDRANVGLRLTQKHRESCGRMATMLRLLTQMPSYRRDQSFDTDVLGDLADQLDQIAMPIVVERKS